MLSAEVFSDKTKIYFKYYLKLGDCDFLFHFTGIRYVTSYFYIINCSDLQRTKFDLLYLTFSSTAGEDGIVE